MEEILKIIENNGGEMTVDALFKKVRSKGILNNTKAIKNRLVRMEEKGLIEVKNFRVKMRIVGNSYAVSIPREIVNFIKEQEKIMNDMVRLCFDDSKRLSLFFGEGERR